MPTQFRQTDIAVRWWRYDLFLEDRAERLERQRFGPRRYLPTLTVPGVRRRYQILIGKL